MSRSDAESDPGRDPLPAHSPARRRIVGSGTREATWSASPVVAGLAPCDVAAWAKRYRRIWVLSPHPDDEVLGFGGSLASLSALGADLCIVAVTDGEGEHGGASGDTPERRAACRVDEAQRSLEALRVDAEIVRLGLPDGFIDRHRQHLLRTLVDEIGDGDLLLATCRFDGEPDHEACGEVAVLVGELTGADVLEYPVLMWHWASPGEPVVPWNRGCRIALEADALDRKRDAITRFQSQIRSDDANRPAPLQPLAISRYVRPFEVVFA